jgi:hypothetical protein
MSGRLNVSIADVKAVAVPILRHRIFTNFSADAEGVTPMDLVHLLLKTVPEPKIDEESALESAAAQDARVQGESTVDPSRIVVQCPQCETILKGSRDIAVQNAKCPKCGVIFPV